MGGCASKTQKVADPAEPRPRQVEDATEHCFASASHDGSIIVWHKSTSGHAWKQTQTMRMDGSVVQALAFVGDGQLASVDRCAAKTEIKMWDVKTGKLVKSLRPPDVDGCLQPFFSLVALDGGVLVSASSAGQICVWNTIVGEQPVTLQDREGKVCSLSKMGSRCFIGGCMDGTVRMWIAELGQCVGTFSGHKAPVRAITSFSMHDRADYLFLIASASGEGEIRIWDAERGTCVQCISSGHAGNVNSLVALSHGRIASSCLTSKAVCIWDVSSGVCINDIALSMAVGRLLLHSSGVVICALGDQSIVTLPSENDLIASNGSFTSSTSRMQGHNKYVSALADLNVSADRNWDTHICGLASEVIKHPDRLLLCNHERAMWLLKASPHIDSLRATNIISELKGLLIAMSVSAIEQGRDNDFRSEAEMFRDTHVELQQKTLDSPVDKAPGDAFKVDWTKGPLAKTLTPLFVLQQLKRSDSKGLQCLQKAVVARLLWALGENEMEALRYAILLGKHVGCTESDTFMKAIESLRLLASLPPSWDMIGMLEECGDRLISKVAIPEGDQKWIFAQDLLDKTFVRKYTRDRKGKALPQRLVLQRLEWVQNELLWRTYHERKEVVLKAMRRQKSEASFMARFFECSFEDAKTASAEKGSALPELDAEAHERWLWHGTTHDAASSIMVEDFKLAKAGSRAGTLYGHGIYLCECCSKSDEYAQEDGDGNCTLLLCRATLGRILYTKEDRPDTQKLMTSCLGGAYHSVLGDREAVRGTFREVVIYDNDQVYPEFILTYKRQLVD